MTRDFKEILLIRFSSIGDVLQSLSVAGALKKRYPNAEVHCLTRADMTEIVRTQPDIDQILTVDRNDGWRGLFKVIKLIMTYQYDLIYDAHNNIRSRLILGFITGPFGIFGRLSKITRIIRPKYRWRRLLLFRLRINRYPQPFTGQFSLLEPLHSLGISTIPPAAPQLALTPEQLMRGQQIINAAQLPGSTTIALSPSASYAMKRWPLTHWCELMKISSSDTNFVILGGPLDTDLKAIEDIDPKRVVNLAGKLTLIESISVISQCHGLVSSDTGLMHAAEQMGLPCIALMGPAPFGYPCRTSTKILERDLPCRPCSKHGEKPCHNPNFQECLASIPPSEVLEHINSMMKN
jgi:ADP-heptose:LPS heptosyltransferase